MSNFEELLLPASQIRSLRIRFEKKRQELSDGVINRDESVNQVVRELHRLGNKINEFFEEWLEEEKKQQKEKLFKGEMPVIIEGNSEKEVSSQSIRLKGVESPKKINEVSIDNLHKTGEESVEKYVENFRRERNKFQNVIREMNEKLENLQKQKEQFGIQKKYCLDLLVKHTDKNEKLQTENKQLRRSLVHYQQKCRQLSEQVVEKSVLLDEIKQFLRADDQPSGSHSPSSQNQKLSHQLLKINQNFQMVSQQNKVLKQKQQQMQQDMDLLLRDNQQFYKVIQQLKIDIKNERNKNKQLIKIEQGKQLNQMVHKENRHLLQQNYQLSNKIYQLTKNNEKLVNQLQRFNTKNGESHYKNNITQYTQDDTFSPTPLNKSKFSVKGSTGQKFFTNIGIIQSAEDKSQQYEQSWRAQKEKNKELESKVDELMEEINAYEEELVKKRKEIQLLNSTEKRRSVSFNESKNAFEAISCNVESQENIEPKSQTDMFMTLKQFTERFQPSLMDVLFIMLRISQLSQAMIESYNIYGIFPSNVYIILDQPDRPQNIHIKINKEQTITRQDMLFLAPEIVTNQLPKSTPQSVIWNIGMVFYSILYKQPYFSSFQDFLSQQGPCIQMPSPKFPQAQTIISSMLYLSPSSRAQISSILQQIAYEINKMFEDSSSQI